MDKFDGSEIITLNEKEVSKIVIGDGVIYEKITALDTILSYVSSPTSGYVNVNATIQVRLKDSNDTNVDGAVITFYKNGSSVGTATTDSNGLAFYNITKTSTGSDTYYVEFLGNDDYNPSSLPSKTITYSKRNTTLGYDSAPTSAYVNAGVTVRASLQGTNNTGAIVGSNVSLYKNNSLIQTVATNSNGIATFSSFTKDTTGSDSYYAKFNGDAQANASTGATKTVTYSKRTAYLSLVSVDPTTINPGESITIAYGLSDDSWIASRGLTNLKGHTLKVYDGSTLLKTFTTPTSSVSYIPNTTVTVTPLTTGGVHTIKLVYEGNNNYNGTEASSTITVNKNATSISVSTPNKPILGQNTITGTLTSNGSPLSSKTVKFYWDGSSTGHNLTTNSNGEFSIKVNPSSYTTYSYNVVFEGDDTYNSSSNSGYMTVWYPPRFSEVTINDNIVSGRLINSNGNSLGDRTVRVRCFDEYENYNDYYETTETYGRFSTEHYASIYYVQLYFAGDEIYNECSTTVYND